MSSVSSHSDSEYSYDLARRFASYALNHIGEFLLFCLFAIVVFDPSDSLTGLKRYVFAALLYWWLLIKIGSNKPYPIAPQAVAIFLCFGLIFPFLSIFSYYFQTQDFAGYAGFQTLIGFLSLALLIIVSSTRARAEVIFVRVVTLQVFATIGIYLFLFWMPEWQSDVTDFGYARGFLWINPKTYGHLEFLQIFFKTAPFMVFPLAYYSAQYFSFQEKRHDLVTLGLLLASSLALLISGTRANMIFAVIIPGYFAISSLRRGSFLKKFWIAGVFCVFSVICIVNRDIFFAMLDPNEMSNAVKLGYWNDYMKIFSDPIVLLFGQGIGAVHYFESLGANLRITEVTLLELIRNFGLIVAVAYILFWIAPVILLRKRAAKNYRWLRAGYVSYLFLSMSNYFILSSTGMVLLSVVYGVCIGKRHHSDSEKLA